MVRHHFLAQIVSGKTAAMRFTPFPNLPRISARNPFADQIIESVSYTHLDVYKRQELHPQNGSYYIIVFYICKDLKYKFQEFLFTLVSEIINSVIDNRFVLKRFDEHPAWDNPKVPGEFTVIAYKE